MYFTKRHIITSKRLTRAIHHTSLRCVCVSGLKPNPKVVPPSEDAAHGTLEIPSTSVMLLALWVENE